ncbi:hypothetical protein ACFW15_25575, partial [Streptomyces sp. NPDC058953]
MNATAVGALLLCRAESSAVRSPAQLLREPQLLVPAGAEWSALVPEGAAWQDGEPVDRVVAGWAVALAVAVGLGRPVLALWWDTERAGFTLASGFRRPVGYVWRGGGRPHHTRAGRTPTHPPPPPPPAPRARAPRPP